MENSHFRHDVLMQWPKQSESNVGFGIVTLYILSRSADVCASFDGDISRQPGPDVRVSICLVGATPKSDNQTICFSQQTLVFI